MVSFGFHLTIDKYLLKSHIPKIAQRVICVEETGSHNAEANNTVLAAANAIQNALIWSIFVISLQTAAISLAQKIAKPDDKPIAQNNIIHIGIHTVVDSHKLFIVS
ncbi:MAG: hypothetical protein LBQ24_02440 [Candidatus Peribacteria bacterium]|jgi:hypothetical protein|nr:hypothetical protein [Candidatus Peribacteria bacterium]